MNLKHLMVHFFALKSYLFSKESNIRYMLKKYYLSIPAL
jgi:hypothetical protein